MNSILMDSFASAPLWMVVKATALLGIAALVQLIVCRRASAATRHTVWTLAIASVLLLPLVSLALPQWPVVMIEVNPRPVLVTTVGAAAEVADATTPQAISVEPAPVPVPRAPDFSWPAFVVGMYLAGLFVLLLRLFVQRWSVRRFARSATVVQDGDWMDLLAECTDRMGVHRPVRLLRSREHNVPVTFGTRRPAIVIPTIASDLDRGQTTGCDGP